MTIATHLTAVRSLTLLVAAACTGLTPGATRTTARPSIVLLVRHGEKATQPANDPSLSDAGRLRGAALADALRDAGVTRVITTQWRRTQEMAMPLIQAQQMHPVVLPVDLDHIDAYVRAVVDSVRQEAGVTVVIGHQNTIPAIITALGGPTIPEICANDYGDLYMLVLAAPPAAPTLVHATVGTPHPAHGATCATLSATASPMNH